jgi:GNAT superfamily N-acetyltransferase
MRSLASADDAEPSRAVRAAELVKLRPISIDDWSDVRYVHGTSFRTSIAPRVSPKCAEDFMEWLGAPAYADQLRKVDLTGAWLDGQLAGTVGWRPLDGRGRVARIEGLFVQPLFAFMGLGSLLLAHAETQARHAGYTCLTALASSVSAPFFMRWGYDLYAQGAGMSDFAGDMPVFVMRKQENVARDAVAIGSGTNLLEPIAVAAEEIHPALMRPEMPRVPALPIEE